MAFATGVCCINLSLLSLSLGGNGACTLVMLKLYRSLMQPILDYAAPVWFAAPPRHLAPLEQLQHRALVRAAGAWKSASHRALCVDLNVEPLEVRWSKLLLRWEAKILRLPERHALRAEWIANVLPRMSSPRFMQSWRVSEGGSFAQRVAWLHHRLPSLPMERVDACEPLHATAPLPARVPSVGRCLPLRRLYPFALTVRRQKAAAIAVVAGASPGAVGASAFWFQRGTRDNPTVHASRVPCEPGACTPIVAELFALLLCLSTVAKYLGRVPAHKLRAIHVFSCHETALKVLAGRVPAASTGCVSLCNAVFRCVETLHSQGRLLFLHVIGKKAKWHPWLLLCKLLPPLLQAPAAAAPNVADGSARAARGFRRAERDAVVAPTAVGSLFALSVGRDALRLPYQVRRRLIDAACHRLWASMWSSTLSATDAHLRRIRPSPAAAPECWSTSRQRDRALSRLRLGTCLNAFLHRVFPRKYSTYCTSPDACNSALETVEHFLLECSGYDSARAVLLATVFAAGDEAGVVLEPSLPVLLGTAAPSSVRRSIYDAVFAFVRATGRRL